MGGWSRSGLCDACFITSISGKISSSTYFTCDLDASSLFAVKSWASLLLPQRSKLERNFPSKHRKCEPGAERENWWKVIYIIQNQELNQDGLLKSYQINQQSSPLLILWIAGVEANIWEGAGQGRVNIFFWNGVTLMALFVVTKIVMGLMEQNREHLKQSKGLKLHKAQQTTPRVILKSCCQK